MHQHASKPVKFFVNINLNQEVQKKGIYLENLEEFFTKISDLQNTKCMGLMSIPAVDLSDEQRESCYKKLVSRARESGEGLVSLGMSGDWPTALRLGSDYLRLGSLILGQRPL